jgi:hypothetical protein
VLFVILKNKLQKSVKVLFSVMGFAVLRSQIAETCTTGGVFQDSFCGVFGGQSRRSTVVVLRRLAPTKVTEYG